MRASTACEVRPVDVNHSGWDCTLEESREQESRVESQKFPTRTPRSSLLALRRVPSGGSSLLPPPRPPHAQRPARRTPAETIERARRAGPFVSIDDFARRTGLGQAVIKRLAEADAFGSLGSGRRQALWQALGQEKNAARCRCLKPAR